MLFAAALFVPSCDASEAVGETDDASEGAGEDAGDGDDCGGGDFQLSWTGAESGEASGDCVVTVLSDGTDDGVVAPEVNVSVIDERDMPDNVGLTLRLHRETEAPIQAVLALREDVGCNQSDVFAMGEFDGTVEFTRRDDAGFAISLDIDLECTDDTTTPPTDFELRLVGTIEGDRDTL